MRLRSRGKLRGRAADAAAHAAATSFVPGSPARWVSTLPRGASGPAPGLLGAPYASWGLRVGGYLIDGVIFLVVNFILQALFRRSNVLVLHNVMTTRGVVHHQRYDFLVYGLGAIFFLIYCTVLVGGPRGQTVGMMAVGVAGRARRVQCRGRLRPGRSGGPWWRCYWATP